MFIFTCFFTECLDLYFIFRGICDVLLVYICVYVYVSVCMCMCVCERMFLILDWFLGSFYGRWKSVLIVLSMGVVIHLLHAHK